MGIKEEITKIAVEQGYEGAKPKSIAQAIDALTDTLAGEDVKSGRSVADAIRKYAPYVGSGGGGAKLGGLVNVGYPVAAMASDSHVFSNGLMFRTTVKPVVGESIPSVNDWSSRSFKICNLSIGSQYIAGGATPAGAATGNDISDISPVFAAAGLTAMGYITSDYVRVKSGIKLYLCKIQSVETDNGGFNVEYTSVSEYPDFTVDENGYITFVIPDLGDNGALVFYHDAE